jgi:8-amino-7-oxononanoate synthase
MMRRKKHMRAGIYPYFREIESDQDSSYDKWTKVLMFGSNSYLGLPIIQRSRKLQKGH